MPQPSEYAYIAAWGAAVGSSPHYIAAQQRLASETNQALDVIFCRQRQWTHAWEVTNPATLAKMNLELRRLMANDPVLFAGVVFEAKLLPWQERALRRRAGVA